MKIVFMGTPDFAVPALKAIIEAEHEVLCVFTQPDKPRGRGHKVQYPPVKQFALDNNLEVFQPLSLRKGEDGEKSLELIKKLSPDCIVVAAYGQFLPEEILKIPHFGCVNIHASLLPKLRGASPINFSIINGDKESGVTIMQMERGMDTGDMLLRERCDINDDMTASDLHDILKESGARLIVKFLENPKKYIEEKTRQNNDNATYAPLITKEFCKIDWNKPADVIHNLVRGLSGNAFTFLDGKRLKIYKTEIIKNKEEYNKKAGTIKERLTVVCGDMNFLRLLEVQIEGGKRISADEFLRGRKADGILGD